MSPGLGFQHHEIEPIVRELVNKDVGLNFAIAYRLRMHALPIVLTIDIQVRKRPEAHGEATTDCLLVRADGEKYQTSLEQLSASSNDSVLGRRRALLCRYR